MKLRIEHIIIGLFIYILFLNTCGKPKVVEKTKIERFTDTIVEIDTIITKIVKTHNNIIPMGHDTVYLTQAEILLLDSFRFKVKDSLIDASILALSEKRPIIDFKYTLKSFQVNTNTLIKDSVTVTLGPKSFVSAGATILGGSNSFGFAPVVSYNHKSGMNYNLGYDLINSNIHVGFTKKISFRNK